MQEKKKVLFIGDFKHANWHPATDIDQIISELLSETNSQLSAFSRIAKFIEQREPFEKTPTQKIKRYLYTSL